MYPIAHFKTITHHRHLVMLYCFRAGIGWQGLGHDLSKYAPVEFISGMRYYQGDRSPNDAERKAKGISYAWLHHKGRNKHHIEYWIDYSRRTGTMAGMEMPLKYVVESVCDRIAASKVYGKTNYNDGYALDYYMHSRPHYLVHPKTDQLFIEILTMLKENGEDATFSALKQMIQRNKK